MTDVPSPPYTYPPEVSVTVSSNPHAPVIAHGIRSLHRCRDGRLWVDTTNQPGQRPDGSRYYTGLHLAEHFASDAGLRLAEVSWLAQRPLARRVQSVVDELLAAGNLPTDDGPSALSLRTAIAHFKAGGLGTMFLAIQPDRIYLAPEREEHPGPSAGVEFRPSEVLRGLRAEVTPFDEDGGIHRYIDFVEPRNKRPAPAPSALTLRTIAAASACLERICTDLGAPTIGGRYSRHQPVAALARNPLADGRPHGVCTVPPPPPPHV